jgi:hypothetical protein
LELPVIGPGAPALRILAALAAGLTLSTAGFADEGSPVLHGKGFTLYAGYQFGGHFTDQTTGKTVDLRETSSYAGSFDMQLDDSSEFQVFYNHQSTEFNPWPYPATSADVRFDFLHIGGTYFPEELGRGVYVMGGLGVTRATPDGAGLLPETRFSLSIGLGYLLPLSRHVGLRFEARGFATIFGSNATVFCSGGCVANLTGTALSQGELLIGLSTRFN